MSVTIYEEGEHPAGFYGVRVAVYIKDKQRQHYKSFRDKSTKSGYVSATERRRLISAANKLNDEWEQEKLNARTHRKITEKREMRSSNKHEDLNTHITGLYAVCNVATNGAGRLHVNYCICIHIKDAERRVFESRSVVSGYSTSVANWKELALIVAKERNLKRIPAVWKERMWDEKHYNRIKNRAKRQLSKFKRENG